MRLALASGKGGVGKTCVAVNLARVLADRGLRPVLADCDVEEPNAHLFFGPAELNRARDHFVPVPEIDNEVCLGDACRACVNACRFKALLAMAGEIMPFPELCHGCGLCGIVCPVGAVGSSSRHIGHTAELESEGVRLVSGEMRIGEAMAPPLIREVKARALEAADEDGPLLYDCPPGGSCPAVTSLDGADFVLLVAEPTPFGVHDLGLAVDLLHHLELPGAVVCNRADMGDPERVRRFCRERGLPLLAELPATARAAEVCADGRLLAREIPDFAERFDDLASAVLHSMEGAA